VTAGRTIGSAVIEARKRLAAAGIEGAALDARLLVADALGCDMATVIGHPERAFDAGQNLWFEGALGRRAAREPLAYVLGRREFWSLSLRVDEATLIPRPDSEIIVETALQRMRGRRSALRVLDLGTGSGCLLIALLRELPEAIGIGVDISGAALAVAVDNARRCGVGDRAMFVRGDWADAIDGPFDLVVGNPPYVTAAEWRTLEPEVRDFEPGGALVAGDDGLEAYRRIIPELARLLAEEGAAFLEIGGDSAAGALRLAEASGLGAVGVHRDVAGRPRCLAVSAADPVRMKKNVGNQAVPV